jgi:hypothetical protein
MAKRSLASQRPPDPLRLWRDSILAEQISMRRLVRLAAIATIGLLAACSGSPSATPSATPPADATVPPSATATPAASPPEQSAEPVPSDELGDFTCELPIVEDATVPRAQIVDVRVGEHDGYDRVVFEFAEGLPESSLERATPPFAQDASGLPLEVDGEGFLRLTMRGGTKQQEDGTSSYDGSRDVRPGFTALVHLIEGGDFEAQSTWYLGLSSEACVRVTTLTDDGPPRLVIDVEH